MSDQKPENLGILLRCYEALRNWRALVMLVVSLVLAFLLMMAAGRIEAHFVFRYQMLGLVLASVVMLIAALVVLTGLNGSGLMLVNQADGEPVRGFGAATFGGIGVTLQSIACLLMLGVGLVIVVLLLWALSFLAQIPGVGPVFAFLLAGPSVLILGFCYLVLGFGVTLMLVALWRGHGIIGSIGRAIDILVKRPLDTLLHFIVLGLLVLPIATLIYAMLSGATVTTGTMYASGALTMLRYAGPAALVSASAGSVFASIGLVFAAVAAVFMLIELLGTVLIFDSLAARTEAGSADYLRQKAGEVRSKVRENGPRASTAAPAVLPPAGPRCKQCNASLQAGDRFCGECGAPAG